MPRNDATLAAYPRPHFESGVCAVTGGRSYASVSSSQLIKGGPGDLIGIFTASTTSGTMQLFDNTAGSGNQLVTTFNLILGWTPIPLFFGTGLYAAIGGSAWVTFSYN